MVQQRLVRPCVFLSYKVQGKVDGSVSLYVLEIKGDGDTDGKGDSRRNSRLHHIKAAFQVSNLVQRSSHARLWERRVSTRSSLTVEIKYETYTRKLVTRDKSLGAGARHVTMLGALQWPKLQSMPALSCSMSLLQVKLGNPTASSVNGANIALRYLEVET